MGYKKNMNVLVIEKSVKVWKKVEKIGLGSFKYNIPVRSIWFTSVVCVVGLEVPSVT